MTSKTLTPESTTILRQRTSLLDTDQNQTNTEVSQVCARRKRETTGSLFQKSSKFFSFVYIVACFASVLMELIFEINRIYLYFVIGFCVSSLASYYKFRVWMNPSYRPDCDCAGPEPDTFIPSTQNMMDGVFNVLEHKKSAILFNVPNTVFGMLFYTFMIVINYFTFPFYNEITLGSSIISCIGSVYLWYTMVTEVRSVCVICSSIHAVSFLTLTSCLF